MSQALIIGAGPAGLMAADVLAQAGHRVTVADAMPSVGRKFLMAGKSGLNLTKAEPLDAFLAAYPDAPPVLRDALSDFGPDAVQDWARALGQPIFTGSTGRVFPQVMKASPLLRAWIARLAAAGVMFRTRWHWRGWQEGAAVFDTPAGQQMLTPDVTVLAMGGASWARLGSTGAWAAHFAQTTPFLPANCGFVVTWTDHMAPYFGRPLKATALHAGGLTSRGEWVLTRAGIEGGGVYEVAAAVRQGAPLFVDLIPDVAHEVVLSRLDQARAKMSVTQRLKKTLRLPPEKSALVLEWAKRPLKTAGDLADAVKRLRVPVAGPLPLDTAISTAGGLSFAALDDHFMLRDRPGIFAAGEMLDWEAPTGGYLITGCLATGRAAGQGAVKWLELK